MAKTDTATITVRVTYEDKTAFEEFCRKVGLTPSTAINMFIKNTLMNGKLPFTVSATPNWQERELINEKAIYDPIKNEYRPYKPTEFKEVEENG